MAVTKVSKIAIFEGKRIRRHWNDKEEKWYFSVVDVITVLSNSTSPFAYWRKMKERLRKEGSQTVTKCHALKMLAADGKMRLTDMKKFTALKYFLNSSISEINLGVIQ